MILLISPKDAYATLRLKDEAVKSGFGMDVFDAKELAKINFDVDISKYQTLFVRFCYPYYQQVVELAERFAALGKPVIDSAVALGDIGQGKMQSYQKLAETGLPIPKTEWLENFQFSILRQAQDRFFNFQTPKIIKWNYGFKGRQVYLAKNEKDLSKIFQKHPKDELLVQEFIPAVYEYKVVTIGYKAHSKILKFKTHPKTFRPDFNCFDVVDSNQNSEIVKLAEQAAMATNKELAKIDILEAGGKYYILEVNRWPGLKSFEQLTGSNVAGKFVEYIVEKIRIPERVR